MCVSVGGGGGGVGGVEGAEGGGVDVLTCASTLGSFAACGIVK